MAPCLAALFGVVAVYSATATFGSAKTAPQQIVTSQPVHGPPPLESFIHRDDALTGFGATAPTGEVVDVELQMETLAKNLRMEWSITGFEDGFPAVLASAAVDHSTGFWPTSVCNLDGNRLAVAGKSNVSGGAVIEIWVFASPTVATINGELRIRPGVLLARKPAFVSSQGPPLGLIRCLWHNRALGGDNVFAFSFFDRDVYSVDLSTGVATLAVTNGTPANGLPQESLLTRFWPSYSGPYRHVTHGDMYGLTIEGPVIMSGEPIMHTLYLLDSDKNGTLDSFLPVTGDTEGALGLLDSALWID